MINSKVLPRSLCLILLLWIAFTIPVFSQNEKNISEEVKIQNYVDAPLEINILSAFTKYPDVDIYGSDRWIETCFYYSIENKTENVFDNYSYEVIRNKGMAQFSGGTSIVPKPFQISYPENPICFPNDVNEDEEFFTFRLTFVNLKERKIWESENHKKL